MHHFQAFAAAAAFVLATSANAGEAAVPPSARIIIKTETIAAPAADLWRDWTTADGLKRVFSPNTVATVEPYPGGAFELEFLNDNPKGERGTEGAMILGLQEARMLSFTWTNRPEMAVRPHRTAVSVRFDPIDATHTRVTLVHIGWGAGPEWDTAYAYFDDAWGRVLAGHRKRMEAGP